MGKPLPQLLTRQDFIDDLAAGCKPRQDWRIGLEHEQFAYDRKNGAPLPYEGSPGIRELLEHVAARDGWTVQKENGNPIALERAGMIVSLEPGGQIEYSGSPLPTLSAAKAEMEAFYETLEPTAATLGIGFLRAGFHPDWRREDINWMPKGRYAIMRKYMEKTGKHGIDMMIRTAGAQVNLDFADEADMVKKYRAALAFQPAVTALMANSRMKEGADSTYKSYRSHIWTDTDPDRCGVPAFVFADDMGFGRYVDYALDVPMYFIRRDGHYYDVSGQSFRDFMAGELPGHEGEVPTIADWRDHTTTLFPEVRLKRYLELRGPDSNEPALVCAMAAFWTGILYDDAALERACTMTQDWPAAEHSRIRNLTPRDGLAVPVPGNFGTLAGFAAQALALAESGLSPQDRPLLAPLHARLKERRPAGGPSAPAAALR